MLILSNVSKLYDGTSSEAGAVRSGVDVVIDTGRVKSIAPSGTSDLPADAARVDCGRRVVTPGLVDCHGHVTVRGLSTADMEVMNGPAWLVHVEKILHRTLVEGGVTTVRDIGGAPALVKRLIDEGVIVGPRLKVAICMLSTTGGHGDFRSQEHLPGDLSKLWPPMPGRPSGLVDGPWECRQRVRELASCGADLIKICTSPGVASPSDHLEHQDFSAEEVAAICSEAAGRGLRVAAHAHSASGIELAIDHGVHDVQHVSFMDARLVEKAGERGCVVTPTSWVIQELIASSELTPFVAEKARKVADVHAKAVEAVLAGGLPMLAGTGPVLPGMHGRNFMEMVQLVRLGARPLQAWHAMTGLAAREIGQDDSGELVEGRRADLLVCDGDVIDDPGLLDRGALVEVLKDGVGHRGLEGVPQRTYRDTTREIWGERWRP